MAKLVCDGEGGCGYTFELKNIKIKKLKHKIEKVYFRCPKCKKDFVAYYTNSKIRQLQKEIQVIKNPEEKKEIMQEIKEEMEALVKSIGGQNENKNNK